PLPYTTLFRSSASPKRCDSVPNGPLTEISPSPTVTSTFGGNLIGLAPMRDMDRLPTAKIAQRCRRSARPSGEGMGVREAFHCGCMSSYLFVVIAAVND